jgi:hypothetical protein
MLDVPLYEIMRRYYLRIYKTEDVYSSTQVSIMASFCLGVSFGIANSDIMNSYNYVHYFLY